MTIRELQYCRISILNLVLLTAIVGCYLRADLSEFLTPEEKRYHERCQERINECCKLSNLYLDRIAESTGTADTKFLLLQAADALEKNANRIFNEVMNEVPPPLFKEYHKHEISEWQSLRPVLPMFSKNIRDVVNKVEKAGASSTNEADFTRRTNAIEHDFEQEMNEHLSSCYAIVQTYGSAKKKALKKVNAVLQERAGVRPDRATNRLVTPRLSIGYHPYLIPVKISLNTRGEIKLSSAGAIPTPIGIFSIEVGIHLHEKRTLTIVYKERRHIYKMGKEPFTFDVSDYTGNVNISYDGKGNVTIDLE